MLKMRLLSGLMHELTPFYPTFAFVFFLNPLNEQLKFFRNNTITKKLCASWSVKASSFSVTLAVLLLFSTQSCNETSAHYSRQQFSWEQRQPLTDAEWLMADKIDTFFENKAKRSGFNGNVLVARNGKVLYQHSFGFSNYPSRQLLTDSSTFQLASASKPFTATAILILQQKRKLQIDDPVAGYISGFPYKTITIRELLNHRSGLANYIYLFDTLKRTRSGFITNREVVDYFIQKQPPLQFTPGRKFQYCNTNYALLAYLIEKISGQKFKEFVAQNIFLPAHMYHTYLYDTTDTVHRPDQTLAYAGSNWNRVEVVPYDGVAGDKGIYSTADDLFRFDQALNHGLLLSPQLLKEAYTGYSFEKPGKKNYGLGWRLKELEDSSGIVYHNGWWRGYNILFVRKPEEGICVVVMSNKYNRSVYDIGALYEILEMKNADEDEEGTL